MIPFYLAASFDLQATLRPVREYLQNALVDFECTSRWLDTPENALFRKDPVYRQEIARNDLRDIDRAQFVLLDTRKPSTSGGMHFECGYAWASAKPIIGIGQANNIFEEMVVAHWCFDYYHLCEFVMRNRAFGAYVKGHGGLVQPFLERTAIWAFGGAAQ